ncbi:MAG: ribosome hibernation-promoting factor, HPF/YfiA family [Phycisphaeraceae bacterium]
METTVTGRHVEITDAIRDYMTEKANRLPRYFDRVQQIEVIADKPDNRNYMVELIVHVEHHDAFVARGKNTDLYACVDEACDKMERQLTDHKEKLRNRKHQASQ